MKKSIALFVLVVVALSGSVALAFNPDEAGMSLEMRAQFGAVPYGLAL